MLEGTLDDFALSDIFRLLALTGKTGRLEITAGGRQGRVVFDGGDITAANPDVRRAALARRVLGAGLATPADVRAAAGRATGPDGLGPALLEAGVVDADTLGALVREQVSDAVFDLMRWERGTFRFVAGPAPGAAIGDGPRAAFEVEPLVAEVAGRLEEWERLQERAPASDAVVAMSAATGDTSEPISLRPDEWRLLALVDGRRTVTELVELSGQGEFATVRILEGMVRGELLEVFEPGVSTPPPPPGSERLTLLEELEQSLGDSPPGPAPAAAVRLPAANGRDPVPAPRNAAPGTPSPRNPAPGNPAPGTPAPRDSMPGHAPPTSAAPRDPAPRSPQPRDLAPGDSPARDAAGSGDRAGDVLATDPAIDADLVRRLIDGVRGL